MTVTFNNTDPYVKRVEMAGLVGAVVAVSNLAIGGSIGSAATTVDIASTININQTTASQTLTLASPTVTTSNNRLTVNNVGSTSFTLLSTVISPGAGILVDWTGSAWSVIGTSSGATNVTVAGGKTFTVNNTLTLAGTDGTTITFPSTSATLARTDAANTFTGVQTMTSPVLITPTLGVATATSYNGLTLSTTTGTFTLTNGKTLAVTNSLTFAGTDGTTITGPGVSGTMATLAGTETLSNKTLTAPVIGVATGTSLAVTGLLKSSGTAGIGYATGAGGTVTQITSRSTGVTLSKVSGQITTDSTSLAAGAEAIFTVTNTLVAATDVVIVNLQSGSTANTSQFFVSAVAAGSFNIKVHNLNATTADTAAAVLNFVVIKGVAA